MLMILRVVTLMMATSIAKDLLREISVRVAASTISVNNFILTVRELMQQGVASTAQTPNFNLMLKIRSKSSNTAIYDGKTENTNSNKLTLATTRFQTQQ